MSGGIYRSEAGAQAVQTAYRSLLDHWPVPHRELRVPTREGETFVVDCGPSTAPPMILLPGSGANAASYLGDVSVWAAHRRVYAVDVIGEPGLSAPSRPPLDTDAYAHWLDDVLLGLDLSRAAFVGTSLGGWLALDYATRRPDRVERLVVVSPSGVGRARVGALLGAALLSPFGEWGRRQSLRLVLGAHLPPDQPVGGLVWLIARHFRYRREPVPRFDDATLARLTMPVLAIVGERDSLLDSAGTRRRLAAAVPHASVTVLPGTGHLIQGEAGAILAFLSAP